VGYGVAHNATRDDLRIVRAYGVGIGGRRRGGGGRRRGGGGRRGGRG